MTTHTASIPTPKQKRVAGAVSGQEKYTFLYFVLGGIALTAATFYSLMARLAPLQTVLLLIGLPLVACAFVFSFMEVRRASPATQKAAAEEAAVDLNQYAARPVEVKAPTGEAYPHHEYFKESQGFDQGQLTSRISEETPLLEGFFERRRVKKENAEKATKL